MQHIHELVLVKDQERPNGIPLLPHFWVHYRRSLWDHGNGEESSIQARAEELFMHDFGLRRYRPEETWQRVVAHEAAVCGIPFFRIIVNSFSVCRETHVSDAFVVSHIVKNGDHSTSCIVLVLNAYVPAVKWQHEISEWGMITPVGDLSFGRCAA